MSIQCCGIAARAALVAAALLCASPKSRAQLAEPTWPVFEDADAGQAAWDRLPAEADRYLEAYELRYQLPDPYDQDGNVDPLACEQSVPALRQILNLMPVSLSTWWALQQCAVALDDNGLLGTAETAIETLLRHALRNPVDWMSQERIRIVTEDDVYILAALSQQELLYVYIDPTTTPHIAPLRMGLYDAATGREKQLQLARIIHEPCSRPGIWPPRGKNVPARGADDHESTISNAARHLRGTLRRSAARN